MRCRVTVLGLCVCVCVSVRHHESCHYTQLSIQPKVHVPTASAQSGIKYGVLKVIARKIQQANIEVCAYRKSSGRLQATWHSKAASYYVFQLYSLYRAFAFVVFCILSVTCSLTCALSQSLVHAQQLFSVSTPGQILAPRVCTLVLFISNLAYRAITHPTRNTNSFSMTWTVFSINALLVRALFAYRS